MTLCDILPGQTAKIQKVALGGGMKRRLLDLGLVEDTRIACVGRSPGGDPAAYLIRGAVIAIRDADCSRVLVCAD